MSGKPRSCFFRKNRIAVKITTRAKEKPKEELIRLKIFSGFNL
jgi:hypothetical protein